MNPSSSTALRFSSVTSEHIDEQVEKTCKNLNTIKCRKYVWRQFLDFCKIRGYIFTKNIAVERLAEIMKDWALNMKKKNGEDYKEGVVKTLWNITAQILQERYWKDFGVALNPFQDYCFLEALEARDSRRVALGRGAPIRKKTTAKIGASESSNTTKTKTFVWRQFTEFCNRRNYVLEASTSIEDLGKIMKDWAFNMKKRDGKDYKPTAIKTMWNVTSQMLQELYANHHGVILNPINDFAFKAARNARDSKRKMLHMHSDNRERKRKIPVKVLNREETEKLVNLWDENTPEGLQKKFFLVASAELGWTSNEASACLISYFKNDDTPNGIGRISYSATVCPSSRTKTKWLMPNRTNPNACGVRLFRKLLSKRTKNILTDRLFLLVNPLWLTVGTFYKNMPVSPMRVSKWLKASMVMIGLDPGKIKFEKKPECVVVIDDVGSEDDVAAVVEPLGIHSPILELNNHLYDLENRIPEFNKNNPALVGTQSVKPYIAYMCAICHKHLENEEESKEHIKTEEHYLAFVAAIENKYHEQMKEKKSIYTDKLDDLCKENEDFGVKMEVEEEAEGSDDNNLDNDEMKIEIKEEM